MPTGRMKIPTDSKNQLVASTKDKLIGKWVESWRERSDWKRGVGRGEVVVREGVGRREGG